ncbi:MAG: hypothetical protein IJJ44_12645 [Solobacterium sp.]|nr:hypothetical protein [Solobacterium sp.]
MASKYDALSFSVNDALRNFRVIYPEFVATPVDVSNDGKKLIVFVGDGYHAITNCMVSCFYRTLESAKKA